MDAESSFDTTDAAIGINILLGLWIAFSPFLLRFRTVLPAVWNNVGVGILVAVLSGIRISLGYAQAGWSWGTTVLGFWLVISPFALHFSGTSIALWNDLVVGVVVVLLSWSAVTKHVRDQGSASG